MQDGMVKVQIPLRGSARESGFETESVWAEPLGADRYRIWSVPVFAYNIDLRAVVEVAPDPEGGPPVVTRVVEEGDCPTVRLYFSAQASDEDIQAVLDLLSSRDALFEKYNRRLWAVGLRTDDDYDWIGAALEPFVERGVVELESGFQPEEPEIGAPGA
jgi:Domain of unknown function (DUF4265)